MGQGLRAEEIPTVEHVGQLPHRSRLRGIAPIRSRPDHTSHHTGRLPHHPHPHDERAKGRQDPGTLRAGETPTEQENRRRRDQRARPRSRMRRASRRLGRSQTQLHAYRIIDQKEVLMDYSQQELSSLASALTNYFEDGEVDMMYLNFSDPWPKSRHEKRRLTYKTFLDTYKQILPENGEIHFKTDNRGLFEYSLASFSQYGMVLNKVWLDLHASDYEGTDANNASTHSLEQR